MRGTAGEPPTLFLLLGAFFGGSFCLCFWRGFLGSAFRFGFGGLGRGVTMTGGRVAIALFTLGGFEPFGFARAFFFAEFFVRLVLHAVPFALIGTAFIWIGEWHSRKRFAELFGRLPGRFVELGKQLDARSGVSWKTKSGEVKSGKFGRDVGCEVEVTGCGLPAVLTEPVIP
jgi:hypothetical protein